MCVHVRSLTYDALSQMEIKFRFTSDEQEKAYMWKEDIIEKDKENNANT